MRDHDPGFAQARGIAEGDEGHGERAHHLRRCVDADERIGREGWGDGQLGVGSEPRQETRVHGHTAHQGETAAAEPQRVDPCQGQQRGLRGAGLDQRHATRRDRE